MTTPDIAGLCKRLDILHEWQSSPRDRETITLSKTALERQAAAIERLRGVLTMAKGPLGSTGPTPVYEAVLAALTGEDAAGSPTSQNTEPGLAFSDAGGGERKKPAAPVKGRRASFG
jgi:hypothetical protein